MREMEATRDLIQARNAHDARAARAAEKALEQIAAERAASGGPQPPEPVLP